MKMVSNYMSSKIKILHLASFNGNIGDNASHIGLSKILYNIIDDYSIDKLEIRRLYKNYSLEDKLNFDIEFVNYINKYDYFIIGGGGFLDYWIEDSKTGTTIDVDLEIFSKITTKILITSVGSIPHKKIPEGNIEKFKKFLDFLLNKENIKVLFRNDGSVDNLNELFNNKYKEKLIEILDNGFFYENHLDFKITEKKYISINTTIDQLLMNNKKIGFINKENFNKNIIKYIRYILDNTNLSIVFIPHIYKDIEAFMDIIKNINDYQIRTRLIIAPYIQGDAGCNLLFSIYKKSELIIGMRLHSNVCNLAMNKKIIPIASLDRVINLYNSIGLKDNLINITDKNFYNDLINKTNYYLSNNFEESFLNKKKIETMEIYKKYFKYDNKK